MISNRNLFVLLLITSFTFSFGQANLDTKQVIDDLIIFQDYTDASVYYYAPQGLKLVVDKAGKPSFKFIQMRYTGTRATTDQGDFRFKSLISLKVAQHLPEKTKIDSIKNVLLQRGYPVTTFKSMGLSNINAKLIHAADAFLDSTKTIANGFFEEATMPTQNTNWKERDFTIRLNNKDAQIFWEGFKSNQPTISVDYSFHAKVFSNTNRTLVVDGSEAFETAIIASIAEKDSTSIKLKEVIVNAGAIPIVIDTERWPDLIKQIDINEQIPPDYAAIDIYCYDFNNELRADLYAKRIEIKATGVGGKEVKIKKTFKYDTPEVYAQTTQFINAIKLSEPYQYRITEIFHDGSYHKTDWITKASWNEILDITTKPKHY